MKSNTNIIYLVALLGICFLGYILWNVDYSEANYANSECVGPGIPIDYIISPYDSLSESELLGKEIFKVNCAACHKVTKNMTGPSLLSTIKEYPSDTLLLEYLRKEKPSEGKKCFQFEEISIMEASQLYSFINAFK